MAYPRRDRRAWRPEETLAARGLLVEWMRWRESIRRPPVTQEDLLALIGHPIDLEGLAPSWNTSLLGQALAALVTEGQVLAHQDADGAWSYTLGV